jgi:hypothetical protein
VPIILEKNISGGNYTFREKQCKLERKKSSKFKKSHIYIDDMIVHSLVKYVAKLIFHLRDIKITNL